jgi:hypothetical protein
MRRLRPVFALLLLSMVLSCAGLVPHTAKVIRMPVEHMYVEHGRGRLPLAYVATVPKEYWDLSFPFESGDSKGIIMAGDAMIASLRESMRTVFKITRLYGAADFVAVVYLEQIKFTTSPGEENSETVFRLSIPVRFIDKYGNVLFNVDLSAETSAILPGDKKLATEEAARQFSELLSQIELDLAVHVRKAWLSEKFKM